MGLYRRMAAVLPMRLINAFKREMHYVGMHVDENRFVGFVILFGIGIAAAASINLHLFLNVPWYYTFGLVFAGFAGGIYFWISQTAQNQGAQVERMLPDALELVASNIKAGLTTERSLFTSARPEFGALSVELKEASKRILSGERTDDSLLGIAKNIKSEILERTIWLLVQGIKSGGQIADLLLQLGSDIREEIAMRDEIKSNISMYVLLIFFAAAFGAPMLFGISSVIVGILVEQTEGINLNPEQIEQYSQMSPVGRFFGVPTVAITEDFVVFYALITLIVTCAFAAFTMGVINAGKEADGAKFVPIILGIALALFFVIRIVLKEALGGITTVL
ncbi:MAG: type II secretion system F family protein [Candidatus Diapherotrites archaeon]|uniref:Type II secretion system F family protein n=1 Tax=Candidatus Iainarchaeum sp. TaxID=3101447 RepID=A0A939CAJ7_9ARCH|nr:type II secretion system F family protein [Candidatus Diapherotrites archaeon]